MRTATPASTRLRLAHLFGVAAAAAVALAGCAVDGADPVEEPVASTTEALNGGGGHGGIGFTCEGGTCTCSKSIDGDCDNMLINCVGDMTGFYTCLDGWLTTDCSCATTLRAPKPPLVPIFRPPGGGVIGRSP